MPRTLTVADLYGASGPILDVRSPGEYEQGHIPGSVSLPLLDNEARRQVGICYKQAGRDRAVELGFALVGPKIAGFIQQARDLAPEGRLSLYCWRGGMRSGAMAWALELAGFEVATLQGGYKGFRRWGREQLSEHQNLLVVGGMTGTGKTLVLAALAARGEQVLDLEGLAHHRGSSYGNLGLPPQPTNEQFWNEVMWRWAGFQRQRPVWLEAESKRIGICRIPDELFEQMERAPLVVLRRPLPERLDILLAVYGGLATTDLVAATQRIHKRLGGLRTQQAVAAIQQGQLRDALELILGYYDRTYHYDLNRRAGWTHTLEAAGLTPDDVAERLLALAPENLRRVEEGAIAPYLLAGQKTK